MPIWLTINSHSGVPIYVQLVDQIRHAVEVGTLQPGEQLPTVRQLAAELTIAPNTIVKAYNDLQKLGLIDSRAGAGTVVTDRLNGSIRKQQVRSVEQRLSDVVRDAAGLGIERSELEERFAREVARFYGELGDEWAEGGGQRAEETGYGLRATGDERTKGRGQSEGESEVEG